MAKGIANKWKRLRYKYKLAVINETSYVEVLSFRLSRFHVILALSALAVILVTLTTLLIAYTGLREFIPGYPDGNMRRMIAENALRVDFDSPEAEGLYAGSVIIKDINWINARLDSPERLQVRVRYRDPLIWARFTPLSDTRARVDFESAQRAMAAGQILALHRSPVVLGGGIVDSAF